MTDSTAVEPGAPDTWWRTAAIYQVFVRSFADGDGDGNGDLPGLRSRLPYLRDLGVDALWITPFYPSPMVDSGFDVSEYCDVNPMFGRLADLDAVTEEAHRLGLRVIVDLVPNHTSDQHPWFVGALGAEPGSADRDRYHFRPGSGVDGELPPNDWESVFGGPAWTRTAGQDGTPGEWYLHLFAPQQPDLNWENPQVRADFDAIIRFWLDRGVDGLRIADAHGMAKDTSYADLDRKAQSGLLGSEPVPYFDQDDVHGILRGWRTVLDSYPTPRIAIGEAVTPTEERLARYVRPDELHQTMNFRYLSTPWSAAELRAAVGDTLAANDAVGGVSSWMLSSPDTQRVVTRLGDGEAGLLRARSAALLTLALPGSVYIYQGEELGLPEVLDLPEELLRDPVWERSGHTERGRDGARIPLPWHGDRAPFGFNTVGEDNGWLPTPESWRSLSVEQQEARSDSTLALYRAALRLRREHKALVDGDLSWDQAEEGVLVLRRSPNFLCIVNTTDEAVPIDPPRTLLLASGPLPVTPGDGTVHLPGNTAGWWLTD
ncbi:glycoside hydrolase family 13 protein [Streptacidiphilus cavernicola]|uniref:Glycoside hydrolase family 13 protein n=1 Tax=Streptacidiphilus cavernicola TaxID=3342716 RepID=A0ABV6VZX8_9ACTN